MNDNMNNMNDNMNVFSRVCLCIHLPLILCVTLFLSVTHIINESQSKSIRCGSIELSEYIGMLPECFHITLLHILYKYPLNALTSTPNGIVLTSAHDV